VKRDLTVADGEAGLRLDRFLTDRCPDLSRSRIQRLIADGHVTSDDAPAKASSKTLGGQSVVLTVPEPVPSHLVPQDIPLDVVFQDGDILVVDKPAGLTVHPGPGHRDETLVNAVLALCPDLQGIGGTVRPGIVHRLDKDTSGLMVVAKNQNAQSKLSAEIKETGLTKLYLALVQGSLAHGQAVIEAPIGRDPRNRKRMAVVAGGRPAATPYKVVRRYKGYTLVEATPATGRTHQVRVHFASLGHPLAGDLTYSKRHPLLERHFLHARMLGFHHPATGEYVEFSSELPTELTAFLESLGPPKST
jgi:23S rRNA pseudouridine1911/1915/1917 synthase